MSQAFTIKECLRGYTTDALGEICASRRLAVTNRDSRIRALEKVLRDPLHIDQSIKSLHNSALRALTLVDRRGRMVIADLAAVPGLYGSKDPLEQVEGLICEGLLLAVPEQTSGAFSISHIRQSVANGGNSPTLCVPEGIARRLPPPPLLEVALPEAKAPDTAPKPAGITQATTEFLETLRIMEGLTPRVTGAGALHKTDATKAYEMAREAELSRESMDISLALAVELGCVALKDGRYVTTAAANEWASEGRPQRMRALFEASLASEALPDIALFFPMLFETMENHLQPGTQRRTYHRLLAAEILKAQKPGTWYSTAAFVEAVRRLDPNVLFLNEPWRAIQANARGPGAEWPQQAWQAHEKRLFTWMLKSQLGGMGIVELSDDGALFRITELGQYVLGQGDAPKVVQDKHHDALVVQPDFEIIAYLDRCPPDLRRKLDLFCERVRGGMATTYRLTQESVYHGIRAGFAIDRLIRLLRRSSTKALPSNVLTQFEVWKTKLSAITIRRSCQVLEYVSAAQAREGASTLTGSKRLSDRFFRLTDAGPEDAAVVDYTLALPPALEQGEGLHLHASWEDANLFLRSRLEEIGHVESAGPARGMTVSLNRASVKNEEDAALLVAQIEALSKHPLAARYRLALRAWAGEAGEAHSKTAIIVRLEDPETCEAILEIPRIEKYVEGRLGLYALVVRQGSLVAFKRVLREHGITMAKASDISDPEPPETWATRWVEYRNLEESNEQPRQDAPPEHEEKEAPTLVPLPSYPPRIMREILEEAIDGRHPVLINYQSTWSVRPATRQLNPVALDISGSSPSVSGHCLQHGAARSFKLARIVGIRLLEEESF
ncbi:MAG: helicase-associated domain-containing protein [Candidatus Hydrogenedentales bacterium]